MSDDSRDDDSHSGGLWDPDAYLTPPSGARPTLRVIESGDDDPGSISEGLVPGSGEALVRLDQFRPAALAGPEPDGHLSRRAIVFAAAALAIAAVAVARIVIGTDDAGNAPPTIAHRVSTVAQQAALAHKLSPRPTPTKRHAQTRRRASRTKHTPKSHSATSATTQVRAGTTTTVQQSSPPTSTATKPKRQLRQYDALSSDTRTAQLTQPVAASEFGFEGSR
jgi:hypothetical protein